MWSQIVTATGVIGSPSDPVVLISPPEAWALRSAPSLPASVPSVPKLVPAA